MDIDLDLDLDLDLHQDLDQDLDLDPGADLELDNTNLLFDLLLCQLILRNCKDGYNSCKFIVEI